jgi:cytochrome bd ubiquinol oxidase subunit II
VVYQLQTTAAAATTNGGAGFAFRKEVDGLRMHRTFGATFAFSSLLTLFFMGTVIGAIATGQIPADASHASLRSPPPARTWGMHHCPFG